MKFFPTDNVDIYDRTVYTKSTGKYTEDNCIY